MNSCGVREHRTYLIRRSLGDSLSSLCSRSGSGVISISSIDCQRVSTLGLIPPELFDRCAPGGGRIANDRPLTDTALTRPPELEVSGRYADPIAFEIDLCLRRLGAQFDWSDCNKAGDSDKKGHCNRMENNSETLSEHRCRLALA